MTDGKHIGNIGYFELYHTEEEDTIRAVTNRDDDFETTIDVPDGFRGNVSSIREEVYPKLVDEHNRWMLDK